MPNPTLTKILEQEKFLENQTIEALKKSSLDDYTKTLILGNLNRAASHHRSSLISLYEGEILRLQGQKYTFPTDLGKAHNNCLDSLITHYQEVLAGLRK